MSDAMNYLKLISLCGLIIISGCSDDDIQNSLLEELLQIGEENSINRLTIDWEMTRSEVFRTNEESGQDEAIKAFLRLLGDNHSIYQKRDGSAFFEGAIRCSSNGIRFANLPSNIGYVRVSAFSGSREEGVTFARQIQDQIALFHQNGVDKWIVDLSDNGGGNMWPMLAGLGPLLGNNILGHFIDPEGVEQVWSYRDGASILDEFTLVQVEDPFPTIEDHKVAVIIDSRTVSSGEATAIAFVGRENTRFFGRPTCGLSTANLAFPLNNGDTIILTVSTMADRNKNPFGGPINPDVAPDNLDNLQQAALNWLNE